VAGSWLAPFDERIVEYDGDHRSWWFAIVTLVTTRLALTPFSDEESVYGERTPIRFATGLRLLDAERTSEFVRFYRTQVNELVPGVFSGDTTMLVRWLMALSATQIEDGHLPEAVAALNEAVGYIQSGHELASDFILAAAIQYNMAVCLYLDPGRSSTDESAALIANARRLLGRADSTDTTFDQESFDTVSIAVRESEDLIEFRTNLLS
jgi:hypothetical protein